MVSLESQTPEHLTDTFRRQRCVGTRILEARGPVDGTSDEPGSWTGRGFHVRHVKSVVSTGRLPGEQIPECQREGGLTGDVAAHPSQTGTSPPPSAVGRVHRQACQLSLLR